MPSTLLTELLATRLCHDLTGPIGAVNNGAEFMKEDGMQEDAIELIASSASDAVARLQFYRVVYGRASSQGESDLNEKRPIANAFLTSGKLTLDWPEGPPYGLGHAAVRLLFNMILFASLTLLRKGTVAVRLEDGVMRVTATGASVKWEESQAQALRGDVAIEALDPKAAQLAFAAQLAAQIGTKLEAVADAQSFTVTARLP